MDPMEQDSPASSARSDPLLPPPPPPPPPPRPPPPRTATPVLHPGPLPPPIPSSERKRPAPTSITSPTPPPAQEPSPGSVHNSLPASTPNPSKRKRGPGDITQNACNECRKKRAKCDGGVPCGRCKSQKDVECVYTKKVIPSKDDLRHVIDQYEHILGALLGPQLEEEVKSRLRSGQSHNAVSDWLRGLEPSGKGAVGFPPESAGGDQALAGFRGGNTGGYAPMTAGFGAASPVPSQPQQGLRYESEQSSPWGGHFSPPHSQATTRDSLSENSRWDSDTTRGHPQARLGSRSDAQGNSSEAQRLRGINQILAPETHDVRVPPDGMWTNVTADAGLVNHLLALYFCWEYPTFASLSKEHFLADFMDGKPRFCSSILVNAILALGCRFSNKPSTRATPSDPYTSGDHFFREAMRLFQEEKNHHNLTTIQALGIMSIREASCGRDSESWYYAGQSIKLAIEMGLHQIDHDGRTDDESAVQAATFWGAFALDHAWSLATGSLPQASCFLQLPPKPAIIHDIEASLWVPYTDDGAPLQRSCEQPSNVRSVYKCFCELSELVHQSLYILHSPGKPLNSKGLIHIYNQYINWYGSIPEVLRLGTNFTPAVLFAHMYYQFALILLFRPLIKLRIIGSTVSPRDVCSDAADAISGFLRNYSQLYTLRRTPSFVPYFVLTSAIMHLAIGAQSSKSAKKAAPGLDEDSATSSSQGASKEPKIEPRAAEAIRRGIADLTEMAPCHFFAEQALNILRFLAKKWGIDVEVKASGTEEEQQGRLDTFDERSVRPATNSLNFFSPNFTDSDFSCSWGPRNVGQPGRGADLHSRMSGGTGPAETVSKAVENPLFWPFPMQGRPMLPTGDALYEAGFEIL